MELKEALHKATQILDEERQFPTVSYKDGLEGKPGLVGILAILSGPQYLNSLRSRRPREVLEDPSRFSFRSTNYDLLLALLSRLPSHAHQEFIQRVMVRLSEFPGCKRTQTALYPGWNQLISEFPLIVEFGIRNGGTPFLVNILKGASLVPGHTVLLRHMEDMIGLNYTVLTDSHYEALSLSARKLTEAAKGKLEVEKMQGKAGYYDLDGSLVAAASVLRELIASSESIQEQCRKARYYYLKGSLLEGLNVEINQDRNRVDSYLQQFGFSENLIECLNKADRLYQGPADAFDLKSSMAHLRSFLEHLHDEAGPALEKTYRVPFTPGWGASLSYLRQNGTFSMAEEQFAVSVYRLISDEAVHPLIAEREYTRLTRNIVIEYALLFLRKLEKLNPARRG